MKVIDLLVKIANGEEVSKRFVYDGREFYLQDIDFKYCYRCDEIDDIFENCFVLENLNEEIEIIEEDKEIKKISNDIPCAYEIEITLRDKLNEVIDIVNKLNKED